MTNELLKCPFYKNGIPKINRCQFGFYIQVVSAELDKNGYDIEYYRMPYHRTEKEAIAEWNTRAPLIRQPDSMVMVPVEPTEQMIEAFTKVAFEWEWKGMLTIEGLLDGYNAMIAARPRED